MNIILTCLNNFQEYILVNIEQLIKLEYNNIIIITEEKFFEKFEKFKFNIQLIDKNTLYESFDYYNKTNLDKTDDFWYLCSLRFFYIYEYMKKYNIENVIHIENDVLLYYNFETTVLNSIDKNFIYIPFDTYERNIASILFIPNHSIFKSVLELYDNNKNDMYNFSSIKRSTQLIKNFPIFPNTYNCSTDEEKFVSENYEKLLYIFDAAAMGQYLGGIHSNPNNSIGFVNETCVIQYNNYKFIWEKDENINRPFIIINETRYPIFNLHIHSKNLSKFI
jgi:hypothetical protein